MTRLLAFLGMLVCVAQVHAGSVAPRDGWAVHDTDQTYKGLIDSLKKAVKANGMFVVTQAGPTGAARNRGIEIPGNRVIGVFNNNFAVKVLETSTAAMIEAPIRLYVTENSNGTATLSYKTPTTIFAPYTNEGGDALTQLASELDAIFATITQSATR